MAQLTPEVIQRHIFHLPGRPPFMLAGHLAWVYNVKPKHIGQAVTRNPKRFPKDFCFRLDRKEEDALRSQLVTAMFDGIDTAPVYRRRNQFTPLVFTRKGANQLSTVLKSDRSAERAVMIMRAFSSIEERLLDKQRSDGQSDLHPDIFKQWDQSMPEFSRLFSNARVVHVTATSSQSAQIAATTPAAMPTKTLTLEEFAALQEERAELYRFKCGVLSGEVRKTPRKRPMGIEDRQEIIDLHRRGLRNYEISAMVGRHKATVRNVLKAAGVPPAKGVRP